MQGIALPPLEARLKSRYLKMVHAHMHSTTDLASGVASLPSVASAFAATQAAWRFLNHERVTHAALAEPMRQVGRDRLAETKAPFALLVHDWSKIGFAASERDLTRVTHAKDLGYELTTALLVSGDDGSPLAPMEMHLKVAGGALSTRPRAPRHVKHLDQVLPTMTASRAWGLGKPMLQVIDREADSVDHFRRRDADGHRSLVRGNARRATWEGEPRLLTEVRDELRSRHGFAPIRKVAYHDAEAELWVDETSVILDRPARKKAAGRKRRKRAGRPLTLRLIVVQLRDDRGQAVAEWMLLSNAPDDWAIAERPAYCDYWRWRIESFIKLLKGHGQQLEHWQQETGAAIFRRLLAASMACVVVRRLQADRSPEAEELREILVRLSGRQTKRDRPHTARPSWPGSGSCSRCRCCSIIATAAGSVSSRAGSRTAGSDELCRYQCVRPVDRVYSLAGSPPMMERTSFPARRGDHGEGPAGGGVGGADRAMAAERPQPARLLPAERPQPGHDAELGLQARPEARRRGSRREGAIGRGAPPGLASP